MFIRGTLSLFSAVMIALSSPHYANANDAMEQALAALDAQLPGTLINNPYDIQWRTDGSDKKESIVESEGVPGGKAYSVKVKKKKKKAWETATRIPMTTSIKKGELIKISYWARSAKPPKGKETGKITIALQRNVDPYDAIINEDVDLRTEWKLYSATGTANRDYSAKKTNLNFNLAHAKQTVEFGQFYIMSLGSSSVKN